MASANYFLKLDGFNTVDADGSVVPATIEIESFSWGATNPGSNTGGTGGRRAHVPLIVVRKAGDFSSQMLGDLTLGTRIRNASVYAELPAVQGRKVHGNIKWNFSDVLLSSIVWSGNTAGEDRPMESIEFNVVGGAQISLG